MYEKGEIPVFYLVLLSVTFRRSNRVIGATSFITLYSFKAYGL